MPKAAVGQTGFTTGEISPLCYGVTDNPRYKKGLEVGLNYVPTLQGPLLRRPGTKYCADVKDSTKPPVLIPFQFSATQNYILEFGDQYIRFYANNGQIITTATTYKLHGLLAFNSNALSGTATDFSSFYYATRLSQTPQLFEDGTGTPVTVAPGSILELTSPYAQADLPLLRWAQNGDTLYLAHPNYKLCKLQRQGQTEWKLQTVVFIDGPYLPANSYLTPGDSVNVQFTPLNNTAPAMDVQTTWAAISSMQADPGGSGQIEVTTTDPHGFSTGQKVFIFGTGGTTEANNRSDYPGRVSSNPQTYWPVKVTSTTKLLLINSVFVHAYTSGGDIAPALFTTPISPGGFYPDLGRDLGYVMGGIRYWGIINLVYDTSTVRIIIGGEDMLKPVVPPALTASTSWRLGVYSGAGPGEVYGNGNPACVVFHQNRLWIAGAANSPQQVDSSNTGLYETFSPSDPATLEVTDDRSCSFVLNSDDQNPLRWMASTAQALLASTASSEWGMTPSGNSEALSPTNFNAQQSSFFGSANAAAVKIGNAVMYIQRASRKLRELAYFFQAGTFRSSDLTELSEHITLPTLTQIAVQKETQPLIWGIRSDGVLTSLVYNRDDVSLSVGWMRHILGGRSNSAGEIPLVTSFAFIPDPLLTFDQMWLVVKRLINGAATYKVEFMTKITDDSIAQEDSFQVDCGGTFDNPLAITAVTVASPAVFTHAAHGLANGNQVRAANFVGLNQTTTDANGLVTTTNLVNGKSFVVAGVTANTFTLTDYAGNPVNSTGYSAYISGGQIRKLVTTISGITWLEGETVGVLADGGIHPDCVVTGGAITLQYPAAKVQLGYRYKSQGKLLRAEAGAADGTSIGKTRRTTRAAFQLHRVGDLAIGTSFNELIPIQFSQANVNQANEAVPLFSGIHREGLSSAYDFESQVCFEQSSCLPGTIQSITSFMEEFDT